ncbi:MAG: DUF5103 domain-containing protein [Ignavibacteriales bacterium]|nr:DUF5103 domain-containing protein [Ignavibacteriales bacterium]
MKTFFVGINMFLSIWSFSQEVFSPHIKGLRVSGEGRGQLPIAGLANRPVTIEFDLQAKEPLDFRLKVFHCDKDWRITENSFINDELRNTTKFPMPFDPAPEFVQHYAFHYTVRIPGFSVLERFPQSGNYIFQVWDAKEKQLFAAGRFFVVEDLLLPTMQIRNRYLPSVVSPWNQVNKVEVGFGIPDNGGNQDEQFYPLLLKTVDVYRNRALYSSLRIAADDDSPNTFVDGFGLRKVKFVIDNVMPGNEYRRVDIRNIDHYPPGKEARPREGADVSRFLHQGARDSNGGSIITSGDRYADYIRFQFELLRDSEDLDSVHAVGDFNGWNLTDDWRMTYDAETKRYKLSQWLRRGVYDYQYVVGRNDWISVEGNNWKTVNLYSAFIYYRDPRYGGFDRIVGHVQGSSPGGVEATVN